MSLGEKFLKDLNLAIYYLTEKDYKILQIIFLGYICHSFLSIIFKELFL